MEIYIIEAGVGIEETMHLSVVMHKWAPNVLSVINGIVWRSKVSIDRQAEAVSSCQKWSGPQFGIPISSTKAESGSIGAVAQGSIHFDFEMAAINAARQVIPEVTIRTCLFHFTQAVQWKLDADGNIVYFGALLYFAIILHLQDWCLCTSKLCHSIPPNMAQWECIRRMVGLSLLPVRWRVGTVVHGTSSLTCIFVSCQFRLCGRLAGFGDLALNSAPSSSHRRR